MYKFLLILLLCCSWFSATGQNVTLSWIKNGFHSQYNFTPLKISTRFGQDDFYLYGYFSGTFRWDNFSRNVITNFPGSSDGFVTKMNKDGNLQWFSHFGDTASINIGYTNCYIFTPFSGVYGLDLLDFNRPISTGQYFGISRFGNDTLQSLRKNTRLTVPGYYHAQYDVSGNYTTLKKEGSASYGLDIIRDNQNNTYSAYFYYDTSWVNRQALPIMPCPDNAIYILKYNRNNQLLWKLPVMATNGGWNFKMQLGSKKDLYFGHQLGRYSQDNRPNPQWKIGTRIIPNTEQIVGYVAKADSNGNVLWVKTITGPGDATVNYLVLDASDNVYVTGYYTQSATFATGVTLNSLGDRDIFLAKYDKNGTLLWVKSMGGTGKDWASCLAIDETTNSLYLSGDFYNTATFATGKTVTSAGENDVFVAWYSLDGTFQKVIRMGGTSYDNLGWCTVPHSGELLVSGNFSNTADFLGTTLQAQATPDFQGRKQNFFIAKLKCDGPLAFESLKLTARPCYNGQSYLSWQAVGSSAPCTFYVERSTDGKTWEDLHSTCLQDRQREGILYYTDLLPPPGTVFYRIRYESADSEDINYSNIVQTRCREADYSLSVYPNPADDKIYIRSSSSVIRWFDPLGQELFPKQDIDGGWMISAFSSGIYLTYVEDRCFKWVKR